MSRLTTLLLVVAFFAASLFSYAPLWIELGIPYKLPLLIAVVLRALFLGYFVWTYQFRKSIPTALDRGMVGNWIVLGFVAILTIILTSGPLQALFSQPQEVRGSCRVILRLEDSSTLLVTQDNGDVVRLLISSSDAEELRSLVAPADSEIGTSCIVDEIIATFIPGMNLLVDWRPLEEK